MLWLDEVRQLVCCSNEKLRRSKITPIEAINKYLKPLDLVKKKIFFPSIISLHSLWLS